MRGTDLVFAPGVSQEVQERIWRMLPAEDLLAAYQMGRTAYRTNDIVLVVGAHDPGVIDAFPRSQYVNRALKNDAARREARIANESAQRAAEAPWDSWAFWLVVEDRNLPHPVMSVLYTTFYETGDHVEAPSIGGS